MARTMMVVRSHRANQPIGFAMQGAYGLRDISVCRSYLFFITDVCFAIERSGVANLPLTIIRYAAR